MSWASRRRATYGIGVFLFFLIIIGTPLAYWYFTIPATCDDGIQNQGETSPDHGGPCFLLDENTLSPAAVLWSRSFHVRDGSYSSVAYIQNSNKHAGVSRVGYRISLFDSENVLVAERTGQTFIMPGEITPIFQGNIDTGNRIAVRTYFTYTEPLAWERLEDRSNVITINDKVIADAATAPHITATALNTDVTDLNNVLFVATVFDASGNAFATSQTIVPKLKPGEKTPIAFTWPDSFHVAPGRIDIIPLVQPVTPKS